MVWNLDVAVGADDLAGFCKGLADPKRLKLLAALRSAERSVGELVELVGVPQPSVSHHLGVLRSKGLVEVRRVGTTAFYRPTDRRVIEAIDRLYGVLSQEPIDERGPGPAPRTAASSPPAPPPRRD